ncbi:hypothetical protein PSTT_00951 [Puccinia striiformis]|uniref:Uncharacterized protein n=1 Tax=Puccinia striiformis TaxID=27350 RepID=A0A2S4W515_9BASI|nr:hypothetical protein PSTT_00951 [Puccinia striiformis]
MQSFHFTSIVLAIFCGLAVAAHHETECVKVACSSFDETLQETIISECSFPPPSQDYRRLILLLLMAISSFTSWMPPQQEVVLP